MHIGVQLPHFGPLASAEGTVALAREAEQFGFDSVWVGDHLAYPPAYAERFGTVFYEAVTTLTWVAAATRRVRVGTAVLVLPYRHPLVLARQLATLDVLSGGRLTVGVGAGWMAEEFAALGVPLAERGARTDEALHVLRLLWGADQACFAGRFYRFDEVLATPRPIQRPGPPVWVGGNTPTARRRAARWGEAWLPIWHQPTGRGFTPEGLRAEVAALAAEAEAAGRGRTPAVAALMPLALLDREPTPEEARPLVGRPAGVAATLRAYAAAGLSHVIVSPYYGLPAPLLPRTLDDVRQLLARFAREVRPAL